MKEPLGPMEAAVEQAQPNGQRLNGVSAVNVGNLHLTGGGKENSHRKSTLSSIWVGSSIFDSWLLASAAQVGSVVLTLPYSLSQMGITYGVILFIFYGVVGAWSVYLLTWLYAEYKTRSSLERKFPQGHVVQYHEVMGALTGRLGGYITYFFIMLTLSIAAVVQLIASASDLYYANSSLDKREWTYIVGAASFLAVLIPNYGHFRVGAVIGVLTTTLTALYLTVASLSHGQATGVTHTGANHKVEFFTGATNVIFAFGGHGITIEILEAMKRPSKFKFVYIAVVFYTLCVVIPSSVAVYWAFGDTLLTHSNAFSVLPPSGWRTTAIASIVIHQGMIFVILMNPVFFVCEKAVGVHTKRIFIRFLVRIPVVAFHWFLALALPFFGPINSVIGASLITVGVYIIPLAAFNYVYRTKAARQVWAPSVGVMFLLHVQSSPMQPPHFLPWSFIFLLNTFIILWIVVVGIGFGGWASITNFQRQISSFGFFDKCYQCPHSTPK